MHNFLIDLHFLYVMSFLIVYVVGVMGCVVRIDLYHLEFICLLGIYVYLGVCHIVFEGLI